MPRSAMRSSPGIGPEGFGDDNTPGPEGSAGGAASAPDRAVSGGSAGPPVAVPGGADEGADGSRPTAVLARGSVGRDADATAARTRAAAAKDPVIAVLRDTAAGYGTHRRRGAKVGSGSGPPTCTSSAVRSSPPRWHARIRRGTHTRLDFPETSDEFLGRFVFGGVGGRRSSRSPSAGQAVTEHDPPVHAVARRSRRALAEDLGPLGDITAALAPERRRGPSPTSSPRADGVLAGTACATEVFAQLDPTVQVTWRAGRRRRVEARRRGRHGRRAAALGAHRRAHRAQLPVPPVGRRHRSPAGSSTPRPVSARAVVDTRKTLPGLRALEKAAVRGGRRGEPPRLAVRHRAREGQPPRGHRRSPTR